MSPLLRGVLVAVVQVGLVAAVCGKLLYDRAVLPRAWVETAGVDPELPIRGRYVALNLLFPAAPGQVAPGDENVVAPGRIEVRGDQAFVLLQSEDSAPARGEVLYFMRRTTTNGTRWMLVRPVAYFLPEHAPDPTVGVRPGELWLEATIPPRSTPRPIRLELRR